MTEARRGLSAFGFPEIARENLALLVSELVTNSVRHAGLEADDSVDLRMAFRPGRVRVEVHDRGVGFVPPSLDRRNPWAIGGQGLKIVATISDSWGVDCNDEGCTVWCEVSVEEDPGAALERQVTSTYLRELVKAPTSA